MATTTRKIPDFFLDGKKRGERVWTEKEANAVPIMFTADDGAAFGFSTEDGLEAWLAKNGLAREYGKAKSLLERAPKRLGRQQESEIRAQQARRVEQYARELTQTLREARVPVDDGPAVVDYLTKYDPQTGPQIHSALLYEHVNGNGQMRYLPKGWSWPNLAWLNFDNMCSYVATFWGGTLLFADPWYRGRGIVLFGYPAMWRNIDSYPYYFNDAASSAITW